MGEYRDESKALSFLYGTVLGRLCLKALCAPWLSRLAGAYMDSPLSKGLIASFVRNNGIDLSICQKTDFTCFNDFFTRQLKEGVRPMDMTPHTFVSPCDGRLSVYPITKEGTFTIKGGTYTLESLLAGAPALEPFVGGTCLVFRLCVGDYHRYHFPDSGTLGEGRFIPGKLHTVRPIAMEHGPVFKENSREYTFLHTDHFGTMVQVEVGAMLVGKIKNHPGITRFQRGQEKGMFLYGGSTVVLMLEPGQVTLLPDFPSDGEERQVLLGQTLGHRTK